MPILYQQDPAYNGSARLALGTHAETVRNRGLKGSEEILAGAMRHIESVVNDLIRGLSSTVNGEFAQVVVTSPDTGEVIGWIGSAPEGGHEGGWFKNLYVGGNSPVSAPLVADVSGRVTLVLGDADDQAYLAVLDSGGNPVVWAGKNGTNYGMWADNLWVGGTGPATAPLFSNGTAVIIGQNGSVSLRNTRGTEKGFLGISAEAPKTVTGAANNGAGLIRLTVATHGYETGDTVDVSSVGGVPNATGSWPITVITANTFDLVGSTFAGAYTAGGTVYRYYGGIWSETAAHGGTGFNDARFRVFADSSLRIGTAGGSRMEVSPAGDVALTDASLSVAGVSGGINYQVTISPSQVTIADNTNNVITSLYGGAVKIDDNGTPGISANYGLNAAVLTAGSVVLQVLCDDTTGASITATDTGGMTNMTLDFETGNANVAQLYIGGIVAIDSGRNGDFASVDSSGGYEVGGVQVVSSQQGSLADITYTPNGTPATYDLGKETLLYSLSGRLNDTLAALRAHGLIGP
jgi:hypothetical protein